MKGKNCPSYDRHPTEKTIQKIRERNKNHSSNCQCISCKSIRGECKGVDSPNYGKKLNHKSDCFCCICKAKRGEQHQTEETCRKISVSHTGDKHPNWQGGISKLPYPFNFNNELKELIRKRDNYTCQLCGRVKEDNGNKLAVHHIDYIKENLDSNNLLTLCSGCNGKVNFNRKSWTKFFGLRLKKKIRNFNMEIIQCLYI